MVSYEAVIDEMGDHVLEMGEKLSLVCKVPVL